MLTVVEAEEREGLEDGVDCEYPGRVGEHGDPDGDDPNPNAQLEELKHIF
jgi:hypothetical protein